jgi:hypothetical protein
MNPPNMCKGCPHFIKVYGLYKFDRCDKYLCGIPDAVKVCGLVKRKEGVSKAEVKEETKTAPGIKPEIKQPEVKREKPAPGIKRGLPLLRMRPLDMGIPPGWK